MRTGAKFKSICCCLISSSLSLSLVDLFSLVVHPNKLLVASGQTAGHDRKEGRVNHFASIQRFHVIALVQTRHRENKMTIECP